MKWDGYHKMLEGKTL